MNEIYSTQEAFEAYKTYLALKQHFTSSYDYFKYGGKINATPNSFDTRKDKFHFYRLSKKKDYKNRIVANFVKKGKKLWVGELISSDGEHIYTEWLKKVESLKYHFKSEIKKLDEDFNSNFIVHEGQHPKLLNLYMSGDISIEVLIILDSLTGCFKYWDKHINPKILWDDIYILCAKYRQFLDYDLPSMKKIMQDRYSG